IRDHHFKLAVALEAQEGADPEALYTHFSGASRMDKARDYAVVTAHQAVEAFAFVRAAEFFELALVDSPGNKQLQLDLAFALKNAGRCYDSAMVFLDAAKDEPPDKTLMLRRAAAEQLMRGGYLKEGYRVLEMILQPCGFRLPRSTTEAIAKLLFNQTLNKAWMKVWGLAFDERSEDEVSNKELNRIDVVHTASIGFSAFHPLNNLLFQALALRLALKCGEPFRVGRSLAFEGFSIGTLSPTKWPWVKELTAEAEAIGTRLENQHLIALSRMIRGMILALNGRYSESAELVFEYGEYFRQYAHGAAWERDNSAIWIAGILRLLGRWKELSLRLPEFIHEGAACGNMYVKTGLQLWAGPTVHLMADLPDVAAEFLEKAHEPWEAGDFMSPSFWYLGGKVDIEIYRDSPMKAYKTFVDYWPTIEASKMLMVHWINTLIQFDRGRAALSAALTGDTKRLELLSDC
ncbi:MAG: tetratricopeptide repeat protein, partial [Proteobacteria bacterium]|nr:tetratricopeptide repeat protein [Pseudomonadota bacterium]